MNAPLDRGPTPETRTKAREGVIGLLEKRKFLWPEHVEAAWLIEDGYRAFTSPVAVKLMKYEHAGWDHRPPEVIASMGDRLVEIVHDYFEWSENLVQSKRGVVQAVTLDLVFDGKGLKQTERLRGLEPGAAKHSLRDGLGEYAKLKGWL